MRLEHRRRRTTVPVAHICTPAGLVSVFNPEKDLLNPTVCWIVQGPRDAMTLLLPGLITAKSPVVRGLIQLVVVAQRCPTGLRR
jgi:hypothetical protein